MKRGMIRGFFIWALVLAVGRWVRSRAEEFQRPWRGFANLIGGVGTHDLVMGYIPGAPAGAILRSPVGDRYKSWFGEGVFGGSW